MDHEATGRLLFNGSDPTAGAMIFKKGDNKHSEEELYGLDFPPKSQLVNICRKSEGKADIRGENAVTINSSRCLLLVRKGLTIPQGCTEKESPYWAHSPVHHNAPGTSVEDDDLSVVRQSLNNQTTEA